MHYVYILSCSDGKPYTGCTNNLKDRLNRPGKGQVPATTSRLPIKLSTHFAISNEHAACDFEKYLKSGSGRAFIKKHRLLNTP